MRILHHPSTDPSFNLAAEEWLLRNSDEDVFMLWRNARAVIVGRNQNTLAEINVDFVRENGISVVRRLTGGGAVFHDLGNLNFTFIKLGNAPGLLDFRRFAQPMVEALQALGLPCGFTGRNDLEVSGRKISGNAQYMHRDRVLHHGTLLFSADLEVLSSVLRPGEAKYAGKAVKSVRSRVGNIADFLDHPMSIEEFMAFLLERMADGPVLQNLDLRREEAEAIHLLADEKYRSWEWNYGHVPDYAFARETRTDGGVLDIRLDVRKGRLEDIRILGDYFGVRDVKELEDRLRGCPHTRTDLTARLGEVALEAYMQNVSREVFLDCLF